MPGPFYFAWVGGSTIPAFSLDTAADIWSGLFSTVGDVWGDVLEITADTIKGSTTLENFSDITSLRIGKVYQVEATGVPTGATITYGGGYSATLSAIPTTFGTGITVRLKNTSESVIITNLDGSDGLIIGDTYHIASDTLAFDTTFVFAGGDTITINKSALRTAAGAALVITKLSGRNILSNIADLTGLVDGEIYSAAAVGIPGGATFTYSATAGANQTLYVDATESATQIALTISKGITEDDGGAFDATIHNVEDEDIFSLDINQAEGQFASAKLVVKNPFIGFLAPARKRWCWISFTDETNTIVPLFHGRIKGVPQNINTETVVLEFIARPIDFAQQKAALARDLRVLPYFDPVWITQEKIDDPDAVLETRNLLWDIDRVNLTVATTDVIAGEDGTIDILTTDALYGSVAVEFGETPKRQITVSGIITWVQSAEGKVDLTETIYQKFATAGSPYLSPNVGSLTSNGLLNTWPKAAASIGGGWAMAENAEAIDASGYIALSTYTKRFLAEDNTTAAGSVSVTGTITLDSASVTEIKPTTDLLGGKKYNITGIGIAMDATITLGGVSTEEGATATGTLSIAATATNSAAVLSLDPYNSAAQQSGSKKGFKNYDVIFDLLPIKVFFNTEYIAHRDRTEILTFTLNADVQPIFSDAEGADIEVINMTSDLVDKDVDLDGTKPIGDPGRNSYYTTDRGKSSIQFLLCMAAAKLRMSARAVKVKFRISFATLIGINCRKNVTLHDPRLPGGQVTGKVIEYQLSYAARQGSMIGTATIGCTIGNGTALTTADGTDSYADDYSAGYDARTDATVTIIAGELQYKDIDGTYVIDDDNVDFFNMTPERVVKSLTITGGPIDQQATVDSAADKAVKYTDVTDALKTLPTRVELVMVPVDGGGFRTKLSIKPDILSLPKTIDLEAA